MSTTVTDLTFPHTWQARILPARPLILPQRHFVYPREAEEVERGALEIMIRAESNAPENQNQEFLATCALGFQDPSVPTGIWSCPDPRELCAVSGGYAYLIDTTAPERFTMLPYRPIMQVQAVRHMNLLLFFGHHAILAWSANGLAWESEKLSSEGITNLELEGSALRGRGWDMLTDKETNFALDLTTGHKFS